VCGEGLRQGAGTGTARRPLGWEAGDGGGPPGAGMRRGRAAAGMGRGGRLPAAGCLPGRGREVGGVGLQGASGCPLGSGEWGLEFKV